MKHIPYLDLKINLRDLNSNLLDLRKVNLIHRLIILKSNFRFVLHQNLKEYDINRLLHKIQLIIFYHTCMFYHVWKQINYKISLRIHVVVVKRNITPRLNSLTLGIYLY